MGKRTRKNSDVLEYHQNKETKIEEEKSWTPEQIEDVQNLNQAISKGQEEFRLALREIAKRRKGGMTSLSKETGFNREGLYKMLSGKGNIGTESIFKIMNALGYSFKLKKK